jgi:hypothetical protein
LVIKKDTALRKVDLHIHTPRSFCYSDKTVTAGQIVEAALAKKLDAIAVTDHNTFEGVEDVNRDAKEKGLVVQPPEKQPALSRKRKGWLFFRGLNSRRKAGISWPCLSRANRWQSCVKY